MLITDFIDIPSFYLFVSNQSGQYSVSFVILVSSIFSYFSFTSGIVLALAFVLGVIVFNVVRTSKIIESLQIFQVNDHRPRNVTVTLVGCSVCGDGQCKRQKTVKDNQPWLGLNIPKDVDQAIQDLYNKIINEFVTSWHSNFTKDESFIFELRRCLRYASSILLRRILQVDLGEIIVDQLITIGLKHVNDYINILQLSTKESISVEAASVKYLNKSLHSAVRSRKSEIQYLRSLSDLLCNFLVERPQLECLSFRVLIRELLAGWIFLPLTDTLCDPYYINSLILLALSHKPLTEYPNSSSCQVQFLCKFVAQNNEFANKKFVFQSNLATILKDQKLLYTFMQFLKKKRMVHILQFCLHVEEFSKKILNPELTQAEMKVLYKEAWDLFSVYFKAESPDSIHLPNHIVQQMQQVLDSGPSNINRLLTNPALFKAYEVAYSNLEESYCPLFYISEDYFLLLCGERQPAKPAKGNFSSQIQPGSPNRGRSNKKVSDLSVVGKLSSKFNKLLQFQAVEGRAYFNDVPLDLAEAECAEELDVETLSESLLRDMSTWHVTIPYVTTKQDISSKPYSVYNVNVTIKGTKENNEKTKWNVERRFNDFYILQAKLTEFHGEFEDGLQLPSKTGMFSTRGSDFIENRRQHFEEYLQKLLQKPSLRGSDLLYFFLHSPAEFLSCLSVQDGLGRILRKSVEPIKLRKERGQKLENFLNMFLLSTDGSKKSGKFEYQDVSVGQVRAKRNISGSIFNNNFESFVSNTKEELLENQKDDLVLVGPWDCILYTLSKLMGASPQTIQAAVAIKNILGQSSDLVIKKLVRKKLDSLLVSARISHLVRLLQDALFNSNYKPGRQSCRVIKEKIMSEVGKTTNGFFIRWFLPRCSQGISTIVDALQFPVLNKHLCYCLLDEIIRVLFPELATST